MNLRPLLFLGVVGFALFGFAGKSSAADTSITPDPDTEALNCADVVKQKPLEYYGEAQGDIGQVEWLARVAFHLTYGQWPNPDDPVQVTRLASLLTCVSATIEAEPKNPGPIIPPDPNKPPPLPPVADKPTPGQYFRITNKPSLNALFKVSSAAYGTQSGTAANVAAAKRINNDPYNARFRRPIDSLPGLNANAKAFEKDIFGDTRITFSPKFGDFAAQFADAADGAEGDGSEYAVIFIPEAV